MTQPAKYLRGGIAALLIVTGAQAAAQTALPAAERVRTMMLKKERGWKLDDSAVDDRRFWQVWKRQSDRITIDYDEHPSAVDASAWLRALPSALAMSHHKPLAGTGDEAFIWTGVVTTGKTTILFRKRRYVAAVTAPSEALAKRVANSVAATIDEPETLARPRGEGTQPLNSGRR